MNEYTLYEHLPIVAMAIQWDGSEACRREIEETTDHVIHWDNRRNTIVIRKGPEIIQANIGDYCVSYQELGIIRRHDIILKTVFENDYYKVDDGLKTFADALKLCKEGLTMRRAAWNNSFKITYNPIYRMPDGTYAPYLMVSVGNLNPNAWVPQMSDILANDWIVTEE